jgi:hypothetical protein
MKISPEFVTVIVLCHIFVVVLGAILVNLVARGNDAPKPHLPLPAPSASGDDEPTTLAIPTEQAAPSVRDTAFNKPVPAMPAPRFYIYSPRPRQTGVRGTVVWAYRPQSIVPAPLWVSSNWWRRRNEPRDVVTWTIDSPPPPAALPPTWNARVQGRSGDEAANEAEPGRRAGRR